MRKRRRATINDLRLAIDCMPRATRIAMLDGIRSNVIIAGAYADEHGICPMLAAHRAGGRTSFISFARVWDRFAFAGATGKGRARRASDRELAILTAHLEASLLEDEGPAPGLAAAIAEHRALVANRSRPGKPVAERARPGEPAAMPARPGEPDRSGELSRRLGWSWMRIVRRYDDYERALERLEPADETSDARVDDAALSGA
jgi:hypothetical protein